MPTVAAVRACKAASGSVAGANSTRAPEAERGGVVGQGGRGKEKLNERIVRRLVFWQNFVCAGTYFSVEVSMVSLQLM